MPTAYVECPDCGQHALRVATRCPRCGHQFPPRPIGRPPPPSFGAGRGMFAVGGAVAALVIVALLVWKGPAGAERSSPGAAGSARPAVAAGPGSPGGGAPATAPGAMTSDSTPASKGTVPAASPAPASTPPPSATIRSLRRYAQTWTNVRGGRSRSAPRVAVLNPGDAVTVDSLARGWYRVLMNGRAMGYVHRSTLDVSRPE